MNGLRGSEVIIPARKLLEKVFLVLIAFASLTTHAATLFWDPDGDPTSNNVNTGAALGGSGTWDVALTNWFDGSSEVVWSNLADVAVFSGTNGTVDVTTNLSLDSILFTNTTGGYTLSGTGALAFTTGGGAIDTGPSNHTISVLIDGIENLTKNGMGMLTLGASNNFSGKTIINSGTLSVGADSRFGAVPGAAVPDQVTFNGGTLRHTATFTLNANRGVTVNAGGAIFERTGGNLTVGGVITGPGPITKTGAGTLTFSSANTLTGPININSGILSISSNDRLGTGAGVTGGVTINGGTLRNTSTCNVGCTFVSSFRPIVIGTNGGTFDISGGSSVILLYLTNQISGGTLTKNGSGELRLIGGQSFSKLVVNAGLLRANSSGGSDTSFGAVPASFTADAITLNGGSIGTTPSLTTSVNRGITLNTNGGSFVLNASWTIPSVITGPGSLTRAPGPSPATSILTLSGTNTYTGSTIVTYGTLAISKDENLGAVPGSFTTNAIILDGSNATLRVTASTTINTNRGVYVSTNGGNLEVTSGTTTIGGHITAAGTLNKVGDAILLLSGTNDLAAGLTIYYGRVYFNNAFGAGTNAININTNGEFGCSAGTVVLTNSIVLAPTSTNNLIVPANSGTVFEAAGVISGSAALARSDTGAGTAILSGANTFIGGLNLKNRTLRLGNKNALGSGALTIGALPGAALGTGNAPTLQSSIDLTGANAVANAVNVNTNFTMSGSTNLELSGSIVLLATNRTITASGTGSRILSGTISGSTAGVGLIKAGSSTLTLNGNNTYTGDTIVTAGTLSVNSSINTAGGNVIVTSGTLGGTGVIGGLTIVSNTGNVGPGSSIGNLTFTNGLDFSATGNYTWELAALKDNADGTAGTDWDKISLTGGNLSLGGSSKIAITFAGIGAPSSTNTFWRLNHTWTVLTLSGSASNPGGFTFATVTNGSYASGFFSTSLSGPNVLVTFQPRPATSASVIAGNGAVIAWDSVSNRTYVVEYKTNLNQVGWLPLTNVTATGLTTSITNYPGDFERYYRVGLLP